MRFHKMLTSRIICWSRYFLSGFSSFRVSSCEFVVPGFQRQGTETTKPHELTLNKKYPGNFQRALIRSLTIVILGSQTLAFGTLLLPASPHSRVTASQKSSAVQPLAPSKKSWAFTEKRLKKMSVDE